MNISANEHTRALLQSLSLTDRDLQENRQGRLSATQRTGFESEYQTIRYGSAIGIVAMVALYVWGLEVARRATTDQTVDLALLTIFVASVTGGCAYLFLATTRWNAKLATAHIETDEGPVMIEIRTGSGKRHTPFPYASLQGTRVSLPHQTLLLMASGARYRIYRYQDEPVSVEALEAVPSERIQQTTQALVTHRLGRYRFIVFLLFLMAIPIAVQYVLEMLPRLLK